MKFIKILFLVLGSIALIITGVGLLQEGSVHIEATRVIDAPLDAVYDNVADLNKRSKWSPWENMDTTMQVTFSDKTKGEGASYSWTSATQGTGQLTYTKAVENKELQSDLDFRENGAAKGAMYFEEVPDGVKVTWTMDTELGWNPLARIGFAIWKPQMEEIFATGLDSLAYRAVREPIYFNIPIQHAKLEARVEAIRSDSGTIESIQEKFDLAVKRIVFANRMRGDSIAGQYLTYFQDFDMENNFSSFQVAVPVKFKATKYKTVSFVEQPERNIVYLDYEGSYDNAPQTWEILSTYIQDKKIQVTGTPWEEYIVGPMDDSDTSKWITRVAFPVAK